jgi:DNA-binding NtrC family response regulator
MSIWSNGRGARPEGTAAIRPEIAIADSNARRRALACALAEQAGAAPQACVPERLFQGAVRPCAVLLALDESEPPMGPAHLARLRQTRLPCVAYAAGAASWPVARRCEFLLAGATALLDSSSPHFAAELQAHLRQIVEQDRERSAADARTAAAMEQLGVAGRSRAMLDIFRTVLRVSRLSDLPVLLTGETGAGKEIIARAIHSLDPRRSSGPLVAVNCSAIPASLAESELFGHRKGAFTGAEQNRKGLFRAAHGGTLFLDEVNELDPSTQTRLLRVIQDSRVTALGDEIAVAVDLRLIAATNRDLGELARTGAFRADLYHRLNVLAIHVPPLRERTEDIEPLIRHFLARYASAGGPPREPSPEFVEALVRHPLPGNVRQLENLIRRVLANHEGCGPLLLSDLPPEIWAGLAAAPDSSPAAESPAFFGEILARFGGNLSRSLDYCERHLLDAALRRAGGNQTQAARITGLTPRSIYNKIRKHRLAG